MTAVDIGHRIIQYVLERRCRNGGYCFYRLEEPNGSDTFYALSILSSLGVERKDEKTAVYLKKRQQGDGSYESLFQAYYCIRSLQLLADEPDEDPSRYVMDHLRLYDVDHLPTGGASMFDRMFLLRNLCEVLHLSPKKRVSEEISSFIPATARLSADSAIPMRP
jgi:hypothetical protein